MQYILYETTNLINGKYYIGVHKIDGRGWYLGSGNLIKQAIKKYNRKNFMRDTLRVFNDEHDAYDYEKLIVNDEMVKNIHCYNLTCGGSNPPTLYGKDNPLYGKKGVVWTEERKNKHSDMMSGKKHPLWGKHHSYETIEKMKISHKGKHSGKQNPMYGIHHPMKGKSISQERKNKLSKMRRGTNNPMYGISGKKSSTSKKCVVYGKFFDSVTLASEYFKVNRKTVSYWISKNEPLCYIGI